VSFAHNADFATGLASSLRAGVAALARDVAGVVVLLGDMPGVEPNTVNALIDAFGARQGALAAIPIFGGRRGNPVLLGRGLFPAVARMTGDEGARGLLREAGEAVVEVSLDDAAVTFDIDTPGDLEPAAG
jgi:molybdenum cofactor cytidylyltransferase